jgi:hypothetical protein
VFLACNTDSSNTLPPVVNGKYKGSHCFKNIKRLPAKYEANTNSLITTKIFEDYLIQLDRKSGTKITKSCSTLISVLGGHNISQENQSRIFPSQSY